MRRVKVMEKINIVLSSDNQYVQHLVVTLSSMFENTQHAGQIKINIIDGGIDNSNKQFLQSLINRYHSEIHFLKINNDILKNVVVNGHISEATYYRILIPTLFSSMVSKIIYLDCDLVIRHDIFDLWNTDIGQYSLGAVKVNDYYLHNELGIPQSASYFNAGILIMNISKWKKENHIPKVLDFISKYPEKLRAWDQDALNGVLYNDWYQIDYRWNLCSQVFQLDYQTAGFSDLDVFEKTKGDPAIVHFTTGSKPWHYLNNHPYKAEYFKYLDISGYPYQKFREKEFLLSAKIALFGTGENARRITEKLKMLSLEVSFYVDNNQEKWNTKFLGKPVVSPDELLAKDESLFVIIASQYHREIGEQLIAMGFREHENFLRDISMDGRIHRY